MMCTSVRFCFSAAVAVLTAFAADPVVAGDANGGASVEFPVETEALVAATSAFFDQVEAGGPEPKKKRPVIRMPQLAKKASVTTDASVAPLTRFGPPRNLTGYRINWYPTDRMLGSVDFMGTWDGNRNLVCGYLTWDVSTPSKPVLETVSANYVDLSDLAGSSPEAIHQSLLEANCAFGSIDANFAFFDPAG